MTETPAQFDITNLTPGLDDWSVGDTGLYHHDELGDIEVKVERIYRDGPAAPALGVEFDGYWHAVVDPSKVRRLPNCPASGDPR